MVNLSGQTEFVSLDEALEMPDHVEKLILNFSNIETKLPDYRIKKLINLEELRIVNFKDSEIDLPRELLYLENLKRLSIYGEDLHVIPDIIFDMYGLDELILSLMKLDSIPEGFSRLKKLKSLGFTSNNLSTISDEIYSLENLESLNIGGNKLKILPDGISNLHKLKYLTIQARTLTDLPNDLKSLKNLEYIHLSIDGDIKLSLHEKLDNLKEFSWHGCKSFPTFICNYTNLEKVQFWKGSMKMIPKCISNLKKLRNLTVSSHPISELPEDLKLLENIILLDFRNTDIEDIDPGILELPKLSNVLIEDCSNFDNLLYLKLRSKYGDKIVK